MLLFYEIDMPILFLVDSSENVTHCSHNVWNVSIKFTKCLIWSITDIILINNRYLKCMQSDDESIVWRSYGHSFDSQNERWVVLLSKTFHFYVTSVYSIEDQYKQRLRVNPVMDRCPVLWLMKDIIINHGNRNKLQSKDLVDSWQIFKDLDMVILKRILKCASLLCHRGTLHFCAPTTFLCLDPTRRCTYCLQKP